MNVLFKLSTVVFIVVLSCCASSSAVAQTRSQELSYNYGAFTNKYFIGYEQVSSSVFMERLGENPQAAKMFKSGRNLQVAGDIVGCIGAFCFGFDLGTRLGGGEGNLGMLIGGGGVMAGGIIMMVAGRKKMQNALTLYKKGSTDVSFNLTGNGVGLAINF